MMRIYPRITPEGKPEGWSGKFIWTAKKVFDGLYEPEWLEDPIVQEMILNVDKTKHVGGSVFDSPWLGMISPRELSGGVKGLILVYKCYDIPRVFSSSIWGDNCARWLCRLSFMVDFSLYFEHCLYLPHEESVMGQTFNALDWQQQDFHTGLEVMNYYIHNCTDYSRW